MSRRKKKKSAPEPAAPKSLVLGRFFAGCRVRVRPGTQDPNFPDIPLGGWSGTVREVDLKSRPALYLVAWDERTLEAMHPVFRVRCEREGLDEESMWLADNDLELDTGEPLPIEQPGALVARALAPNEPGDRVRAIFQLTSDDPLPEVNDDTLRVYHHHLSERLKFPFAALYEDGPFLQGKVSPILVLRLLPPEEAEDEGLLVEVARGDERLVVPLTALELAEEDPQAGPIADYASWLEDELGPVDNKSQPGLTDLFPGPTSGHKRHMVWLFLQAGLFTAACGSLVGSVVGALSWGRTAVTVGAALTGALGLLLGAKYGVIFGAVNRIRTGVLLCGLFGVLVGSLLGALLGAAVVAFVGTILGSIAGTLAGQVVAALGRKPLSAFSWAMLGAWVGGLFLAYSENADLAISGAVTGAILGGVSGLLLPVFFLVGLGLLMSFRR